MPYSGCGRERREREKESGLTARTDELKIADLEAKVTDIHAEKRKE